MENVRKRRNIKHVTTERRKNYQVFPRKLLAKEMRKTQILMNKLVYLGLSKLDLIEIIIHEFWYNYIKPKYGENANPYYMDTDSFIVQVKIDEFYKDMQKMLK